MNIKIKKILNKKNKLKIICLTAYSKNFAEEVDKYADITLVGDSLGSVLYNYNSTKKVTLTNMIDHSKSVRMGVKKSLMVVDMPYNTYKSNSSALKNAIESFIDEIAMKAGKNPVDFRVGMLGDEGTSKRIKDVIQLAASKGNYKDKPENGIAMGFAASVDSNSPAAHVVEVSIVNNEIKVHKVTCAFDCGLVVNPDQVKAQCEGSIIMGISGSMHEKMTLKDGELYPTIYGPYDMALMKNSPKEIDVHFIQGVDIPLPVGEPPMGPIAAAVANAVKRLTGKRLTDLPLKL